MNRIDIPLMAKQLNLLAEVFDKKHVTESAAVVWFDTLKDFPLERVTGILIGWPKLHGKFPTPAEIWKACNEGAIEEREKKALREARENRQDWRPHEKSFQAEAFIAKMRVMLKKPKRTPLEHWQHVYQTFPKDSIGYRAADEVLTKWNQKPGQRTPGEDDERIAA